MWNRDLDGLGGYLRYLSEIGADGVIVSDPAVIELVQREQLSIPIHQMCIRDRDDGVCAIGSGGSYALAAARALSQNTDMTAKEIAYQGLKIASEICVYTNDNIRVEEV